MICVHACVFTWASAIFANLLAMMQSMAGHVRASWYRKLLAMGRHICACSLIICPCWVISGSPSSSPTRSSSSPTSSLGEVEDREFHCDWASLASTVSWVRPLHVHCHSSQRQPEDPLSGALDRRAASSVRSECHGRCCLWLSVLPTPCSPVEDLSVKLGEPSPSARKTVAVQYLSPKLIYIHLQTSLEVLVDICKTESHLV